MTSDSAPQDAPPTSEAKWFDAVTLVPYRLPELLSADLNSTVYIVEGEKDVDRLWSLGLVSTCNPMGAGKWENAYTAFLKGRCVVILPDNDDKGRDHAHKVAGAIQQQVATIKIVELGGLPPGGDVSDWLDAGGTASDLIAIANNTSEWRANDMPDHVDGPPKRRKFQLYSVEDLAKRPAQSWLIDRHIPQGSLSVVYGPSENGKSFCALNLALSVACGFAWNGCSVKQGPVVYLSSEGGEGMPERVKAWSKHKSEETGTQVDTSLAHFLFEPINLMAASDVIDLLQELRTLPTPPVLIVLDTLARCLVGGDENSAKDVGRAIAHIDLLRRETGAAVLLVHHTGKNSSDIERGSSALRGAADTMILVKREKEVISLSCEKQKDAERFEPSQWRLQPVGDTASCVPIYMASGRPVKGRGAKKGLTTAQRRVLEAVQAHGGGVNRSELIAKTGISRSTVYDATERLVEAGFIHQDRALGLYYAGGPDCPESSESDTFGQAASHKARLSESVRRPNRVGRFG